MKKAFLGILLLMSLCLTGCASSQGDQYRMANTIAEKQKLTVELVSWFSENDRHWLARRIKQFGSEHPNVEIKIQWNPHNVTKASWDKSKEPAYLYEETSGVEIPDLVELAPDQMRELYRLGKLEPLNMNRTAIKNFIIPSTDGYVLGVISKMNPLIVYYNQAVFEMLDLDPPTEEWGIQELNDIIWKLKHAGQGVFIPMSPYTLEWATSLYGGRIVASDGMTYAGYLNSKEAVQGAEWLASIGTEIRNVVMTREPVPMPYWLINGKYALAVEFAYGFNPNGTNSYEEIIEQNAQVAIADLPKGFNGINPAQVSGLSITSQSTHKSLAMELLLYLITDPHSFYKDVALNTLQSNAKNRDVVVNPDRVSIVTREMKHSIPATFYLNQVTGNLTYTLLYSGIPALTAIRNGKSAAVELDEYARELDSAQR